MLADLVARCGVPFKYASAFITHVKEQRCNRTVLPFRTPSNSESSVACSTDQLPLSKSTTKSSSQKPRRGKLKISTANHQNDKASCNTENEKKPVAKAKKKTKVNAHVLHSSASRSTGQRQRRMTDRLGLDFRHLFPEKPEPPSQHPPSLSTTASHSSPSVASESNEKNTDTTGNKDKAQHAETPRLVTNGKGRPSCSRCATWFGNPSAFEGHVEGNKCFRIAAPRAKGFTRSSLKRQRPSKNRRRPPTTTSLSSLSNAAKSNQTNAEQTVRRSAVPDPHSGSNASKLVLNRNSIPPCPCVMCAPNPPTAKPRMEAKRWRDGVLSKAPKHSDSQRPIVSSSDRLPPSAPKTNSNNGRKPKKMTPTTAATGDASAFVEAQLQPSASNVVSPSSKKVTEVDSPSGMWTSHQNRKPIKDKTSSRSKSKSTRKTSLEEADNTAKTQTSTGKPTRQDTQTKKSPTTATTGDRSEVRSVFTPSSPTVTTAAPSSSASPSSTSVSSIFKVRRKRFVTDRFGLDLARLFTPSKKKRQGCRN